MLIRMIPDDTRIDFISRRFLTFAFSALLIAASIGLLSTRGLNLGIDFLGGIVIEAKTDGPADITKLRTQLNGLGLGDISLQEFGEPDDVLIRVQRQEGDGDAQQAAIDKIKGSLGSTIVEYRRTESVGPTVGAELQEAALYAVMSAIVAILLYVWFRFEWQYGLSAVLALMHDVIATLGFFAITGLEFNLSTVAAVLTVVGYSINDTVVVFDRVREDLRRYKKRPLAELFNEAINSTLSRTTMTSFTTLLALFALAFFGGEVIRAFSLSLIFGIVVGTYSSIALAVPLLLYLRPKRGDGDTAEDAGKSEAKADTKPAT